MKDDLLIDVKNDEIRDQELVLINSRKSEEKDKIVSNINEQVWKEINSVPSAVETFLEPSERPMDENDNYFNLITNHEFFKQYDISPDLTPKHRYLMQRYFE